MAKTSMIYRDLKRKRLAEQYRAKRADLKRLFLAYLLQMKSVSQQCRL